LLVERDPQEIRDLLSMRRSRKELEIRIASSLGTTPAALWREVDGIVRSHFASAASSG
jgi:hypothetical protein